MKVLNIITSLNTGGAEKLVVDSLPLYGDVGVEVDLLVLLDLKSLFYEELKKNFSGEIFFLSKGSVYNPLHIFSIMPYLKNYDIIHVHLFPALYWVVFAKILSFCNVPIVYTEHSTNNKRRNSFFLRYVDKIVYKKLQSVICISEKTKNNLKKHIGKSNIEMPVISNGIVLSNYNSICTRINYEFLSSNDFVLIQVSSFRYPKDQHTIIKAMVSLPSNIKLIFAGDGVLKEECIQLSKDLGVSDRIFFLGNRGDISGLIAASDVFILSSAYEGVPLSIIEGMASGKPVVGSNVDGIAEIIGDFGLLFEYQNDIELVDVILKLHLDDNLYKKYSAKSLNRVNDFDISKMVSEYLRLYNKGCDK